MYILYKNQNYPCDYIITENFIDCHNLPETFPLEVSGPIYFYADTGFLRRSDNTENYKRVIRYDDVLTLTNLDEPTPPEDDPDPVDPAPSLEERVQLLEIEVAQEKAKSARLEEELTYTQLALVEVYESTLSE